MSMKSLLPLSLLAACAAQPVDSGAPAKLPEARPAELVGYLLYAEEYEIYPTEAALRRRLAGKRPRCISALHTDGDQIELVGRRFSRTKVRLVGHYEDWEPLYEIYV